MAAMAAVIHAGTQGRTVLHVGVMQFTPAQVRVGSPYDFRKVEHSKYSTGAEASSSFRDARARIAITRFPWSLQYSTVFTVLFNDTTAQGTGLGGSAGNKDVAELDFTPTL